MFLLLFFLAGFDRGVKSFWEDVARPYAARLTAHAGRRRLPSQAALTGALDAVEPDLLRASSSEWNRISSCMRPRVGSTFVRCENHPSMDLLDHHPHADLFPLLSGADFDALVADIKVHGLRIPIVLHDGKILDGRNRHRACIRAGVEPRFEDFDGTSDEALALVVSLNLARRHLTTPQRAVLALQLLPMEREMAQQRMGMGRPPQGEPQQKVAEVSGQRGQATELAGARVGVSKETVRQATMIAEQAPDVIAAMREGVVHSMPEAQRLAGFDAARRLAVIGRMRDEGVRLKDADTVSTTWSRSSGSCEWYTPPDIIEAACDAMGGPIDLDPASADEAQATVKAARYHTINDDGLQQPWIANRLWMNPPFGTIGDARGRQSVWLDKLLAEVGAGRVLQAVVLVRVATESLWFEPLWDYPLCFVRGRPRFIPGPGAGEGKNKPNLAIAVVGVGVDTDRFARVFYSFGRVVLPTDDGESRSLP